MVWGFDFLLFFFLGKSTMYLFIYAAPGKSNALKNAHRLVRIQ